MTPAFGPVAHRALKIGTRGSALARRQTELVAQALRRIDPAIPFTTEVIRTQGDEAVDVDFSQLPTQGVFVRGIETALLSGEVDIAVHSYKDVPSTQPPGLVIAAVLPRDDPRDALVARDGLTLDQLPSGATIGTGSPRRQTLLREARPDLSVRPLRGNVDTRLRRVAEGDLDAVVLAAAGLARLGRTAEATELLDPGRFVPAVGQGMIAIEARSESPEAQLLQRLDDWETRACAVAERAVALTIGAGCQTPFGAYAHIEGGRLKLAAFLDRGEGRGLVRAEDEADPADAVELGNGIGQRLLAVSIRGGS